MIILLNVTDIIFNNSYTHCIIFIYLLYLFVYFYQIFPLVVNLTENESIVITQLNINIKVNHALTHNSLQRLLYTPTILCNVYLTFPQLFATFTLHSHNCLQRLPYIPTIVCNV